MIDNVENVDCVIVTYNRLELLKECLNAVLYQSYPLRYVFVVDNNSSDGTSEYLKKYTNDSQVRPIHLSRNLGGAGGFNRGIEAFHRHSKSDFVWIMDDDTIPRVNTLEKLMYHAHRTKSVGFLASNVKWTDGTAALMNVPHVSEDWSNLAEDGLVQVKSASFVSILFPRKVVTKVGLPITDFFIWGDDTEYTSRISQNDMEGYFVSNSIVKHKMKSNSAPNIVFEDDRNRINRFYYAQRNHLYIARKYRGFKSVLKVFIKQLLLDPVDILIHSKNRRVLRIFVTIKGTMAGVFFNPEIQCLNHEK